MCNMVYELTERTTMEQSGLISIVVGVGNSLVYTQVQVRKTNNVEPKRITTSNCIQDKVGSSLIGVQYVCYR